MSKAEEPKVASKSTVDTTEDETVVDGMFGLLLVFVALMAVTNWRRRGRGRTRRSRMVAQAGWRRISC